MRSGTNDKKRKRVSSRNDRPRRPLFVDDSEDSERESGSPTHKRLRQRNRKGGGRSGGVPTNTHSESSSISSSSSSSDEDIGGGAGKTTHATSSGINPLLVPEILENVVKFVSSPNDLNSCREVCTDWNQAFSRKASRSGTVQCECFLVSRMGYSKSKHAFKHQYPEAPVQRIRVRDPGFALWQSSVKDFFEHHGSHITHLTLDAEGWCCLHFTFFENVLFKWCDNLEHLQLHGFDKEGCDMAMEATASQFEHNIPNLKTLRITGVKESRSLGVIELVFRCATRLQSFTYTGDGTDDGAPACVSTGKSKSRRKKKKKQVASTLIAPTPNVRYMRYYASELATLDFSGVWLSNSDVEEITAAGWPLKKLVIGGISRAEGSVVRSLLESLAGTLEYLDIGGGVSSNEKMQTLMMAGRFFSVRFPVMDRLVTLKLRDICTFRAGTSLGFLAKKFKRLAHLTLATQQASKFLSHLDVNSMLRGGSCPSSLQSLCLGGDFGKWDNAKAAAVFGNNVREVKLYSDVGGLGDLLDAWSNAGQLEHLAIDLHVPARVKNSSSSLFNRAMRKGLQDYRLNVLSISTDRDVVLQADTVADGILQRGNASYYRVQLHGFTVLDRDAKRVASLLAERVNFTRMVNCRVERPGTLAFSPITVHLPEIEFGSFNIDEMVLRYFHAF